MTVWCPGFLPGYTPTNSAWGLVRFSISYDTHVVGVEFWTFDATEDVDVYLYDRFDGEQPSGLRHQSLGHKFAEAGYHSVSIEPPVPVHAGSDVVVVVQITNLPAAHRRAFCRSDQRDRAS